MDKPRPFYYSLIRMISVISPVYNEEKTVAELHHRIINVMQKQSDSYEIIFVNDNSTDNTLEEMKNLKPLKIISLQRNYGETPALDVGIQEARGDIIVLTDADLQDDPANIPLLLNKISEGYDVVAGWRQNRKDHLCRIIFSRLANFVLRIISGVKIHDFGCGLKAYRAKFIKDFRLWGDSQVFLPAVAQNKGAIICEVPIAHYPRKEGSSRIKAGHLIKSMVDLVSLALFIRYFSKPLRFFGGWGIVSAFLSFTAFGVAIILRIFGVENFTATPLPIVGTLFAILGVLLFMMGLLAETLLRMYYANINLSLYTIREIKENK